MKQFKLDKYCNGKDLKEILEVINSIEGKYLYTYDEPKFLVTKIDYQTSQIYVKEIIKVEIDRKTLFTTHQGYNSFDIKPYGTEVKYNHIISEKIKKYVMKISDYDITVNNNYFKRNEIGTAFLPCTTKFKDLNTYTKNRSFSYYDYIEGE